MYYIIGFSYVWELLHAGVLRLKSHQHSHSRLHLELTRCYLTKHLNTKQAKRNRCLEV